MAVELDFLTRITNVHWGGNDVIVVFMEASPFRPQPVFELTPTTDKAAVLGSWQTPTYSRDPAPFKNTAYKVKSNTGEFLKSISPQLPPGDEGDGTWLYMLVFAEDELSKIQAATELMAPALYQLNALNADLPSEVAPPGLLWAIETGAMPADVAMTWKIRFGDHRDPAVKPPPPPNAMVQCYPTNDSHPGPSGMSRSSMLVITCGPTVWTRMAQARFIPNPQRLPMLAAPKTCRLLGRLLSFRVMIHSPARHSVQRPAALDCCRRDLKCWSATSVYGRGVQAIAANIAEITAAVDDLATAAGMSCLPRWSRPGLGRRFRRRLSRRDHARGGGRQRYC